MEDGLQESIVLITNIAVPVMFTLQVWTNCIQLETEINKLFSRLYLVS